MKYLCFLALPLMCSGAAAQGNFTRGDANSDCLVDISDAVRTLGWLFLGGPEPACFDAADANDDGVINIVDPVLLLQNLFQGDASLPAPFPRPGSDPTPDSLACDGWALQFGPLAFFEVFDSPSLSLSRGFSICAWIYLDKAKQRHRFFVKSTLNGEGILLEVRHRPKGEALPADPYPRIKFHVQPNFPTDGLRGRSEVPLRRWVHIAATLEGTLARVYLDGEIDGELSVPQGILGGTSSILVGATPLELEANGIEGLVDRLAIFNRAISQNEVKDVMCGRLGQNALGCVGFYAFDECDPNANATDSSLFGNHGRMGHASAPDVADPVRVRNGIPSCP